MPVDAFGTNTATASSFASGTFSRTTTGSETVTFPEAFSQVPVVTATSDVGDARVGNITTTGFDVTVFDSSGTARTGVINWHANLPAPGTVNGAVRRAYTASNAIAAEGGTHITRITGLTPGSAQDVTLDCTGWVNGNVNYGISIAALDSAGARIGGNVTPVLDLTPVRDQTWALLVNTAVANNVQHAMRQVAMTATVPADGILDLELRGHGPFFNGEGYWTLTQYTP